MKVPSEFDPIRPLEPEELSAAYDKLLADDAFKPVLAYIYPNVPIEAVSKKMHACKTNLEFQRAFCYPILSILFRHRARASTSTVIRLTFTTATLLSATTGT